MPPGPNVEPPLLVNGMNRMPLLKS